eukprot:CAMPEP_0170211572 /NCGR_PEP_ID=MMETSP0116_2-20130129/5402_1 /TAXON_ID=400756 /ORGANISM="Durinskia baltica, Strain CSIRO CS-38" /LENGTH=87 /DNA_ID=CAMNT_0010462107 /DNA_START=248 /DNA_END=511 /DNA_ORIENTATION=-
MKKAIKDATLNAATMGTNKMAGVPNKPPNTSDKTVVGSKVAAERWIDADEDTTDVVVVAAVVVVDDATTDKGSITRNDDVVVVVGMA